MSSFVMRSVGDSAPVVQFDHQPQRVAARHVPDRGVEVRVRNLPDVLRVQEMIQHFFRVVPHGASAPPVCRPTGPILLVTCGSIKHAREAKRGKGAADLGRLPP